jgi:quercetin dioxygenase-like cupin family protein
MSDTKTGPHFFLLDEIEWPTETQAEPTGGEAKPESTSRSESLASLVQKAKQSGARRKYLARGEGGFFTQYSEFPAGFTVPPHTHDHDEVIICMSGSLTMLGDDGPTLRAGDSMVLIGGYEYGFTAGPDGMSIMTIRTAVAGTTLTA